MPTLPRRPALLCAAFCAALTACAPVLPPSAAHPLAGNPMPEIQRRTLDGTQIDTVALRGKVTVVKFFAKYCEPCKKTLPAVEALAEERKDIAFIGVAEDEHESDVREMVSLFHLSFPIIHDASNVLSGRYRVNEIPVTFVVDERGAIRWVGGPTQTEAEVVQAIRAIAR